MVTENEDDKIVIATAPKKAKSSRNPKPVPTPEESAAAGLAATPASDTAVAGEDDAFNFHTQDVDGYVPDQSLMRQTYEHQRNHKRYMVVGFCWNSVTDQWGLLMLERHVANPVPITRPVADLTSKFEDGSDRYLPSPDKL